MQSRITLLAEWCSLLLPLERCRQITAARAMLAVAAFWMFVGQSAGGEQRANCRPHDVAVFYEDPSELAAACRAVSDVVGYFSDIGFEVPSNVSVHFANPGSHGSTGHSPAHGLFDPLRSRIVIYRASEAKPWGQAWSPKLVGSFLRHEIVHVVIWEVVKADPKRLRREWHEFMAYAIQFDLMDPELRNKVLAMHTHLVAVKHLTEINEFSYGMNPEGFAVVAYKTYLERGAGTFVRQLLKSEITPPAFSYPFAVQPHEVRP